MKRRKWPLKGYHRRFIVLDDGWLKYGKNEEMRRAHGALDLGDAAINKDRKDEIHIDTNMGSPIHLKPIRGSEPGTMAKMNEALRAHKQYRRQSMTSLHVVKPITQWTTKTSVHKLPIVETEEVLVTRRSSLEDFTTTREKFNHVESKLRDMETLIVQLTSFRADLEEALHANVSPKKSRFRPSIKRNKRESSKTSNSSNQSTLDASTLSISEDNDLTNSQSLSRSQPDLTGISTAYMSADGPLSRMGEFQRQFEDLARRCVNDARHIKSELVDMSNVTSTKRNSLEQHSGHQNMFEIMRENEDMKLKLQHIRNFASVSHLGNPPPQVRSSTTMLNNSHIVESMDGSTTDTFYDAESDLEMSGDSSDDNSSLHEIDERDTDTDEDMPHQTTEMRKTETPVGPAGFNRRSRLPVPIPEGMQVSLWNVLRKNMGKDLTKVAMPVSFNEPLSALQKMAEDLEYSYLLDQAVNTTGVERMVNVAAFALSCYGAEATRQGRKPFNPVLGETYELIRDDLGWKFCAEQVSHHPPIGCGHTQGQGWTYWLDFRFKNKFWGKSIEITPLGKCYLKFADGSTYSWTKVTSCIHNIISGQKYVEKSGDCVVEGPNGMYANFTFQKSGWVTSSRNEVVGEIRSQDGTKVKSIFGRWDEGLYVGEKRETAKNVWRQHALSADNERYYGFTRFAIELNEILPEHEGELPHTDSRWRPDQQLLEQGRIQDAENEKKRVEDIQRKAARRRDAKSEKYNPRFFKLDSNGEYHFDSDHYWQVRNESDYWTSVKPLW